MSDNNDTHARLNLHRRSIDNIDAALIHMLAERFSHTDEVGALKADMGLNATDPKREAQQIARIRKIAADAGLNPEFSEAILRFIIQEVVCKHHAWAKRKAATLKKDAE